MNLLDTAVWANRTLLPNSVPARVEKLLTGRRVAVCSISLLEAALLHRKHRLEISGTLPEFYAVAVAGDVDLLELSPAVAARVAALPEDFHADPFDRVIFSTAAELRATLFTTDEKLRDQAKRAGVACEFYEFKPAD